MAGFAGARSPCSLAWLTTSQCPMDAEREAIVRGRVRHMAVASVVDRPGSRRDVDSLLPTDVAQGEGYRHCGMGEHG
jgi:hypothetical protein